MRNNPFLFLNLFLLLLEVFGTEALAAIRPDIALFALSVYFLLKFLLLFLHKKKLRLSHGK